jgi:LPXTG-site transpeptidase (sortase) family protein
MEHKQAGSSRAWLLPALLSVGALVLAAGLWWQGSGGAVPQVAPAPSTPPVTATVEVPAEPGRSVAPQPKRSSATELPGAGPPRTVLVESLGINAPVVPIALEGTSLDPPDDPQVLGWWSGGASAGAAAGTALVTGHTVNAGGGAMDNLERIRPGAEIRVLTARGSLRYVAESVQVLDKDAIARQAQQLFSQQVPGRLVLVTCEDWDGTAYRSNVVVTARPVTA